MLDPRWRKVFGDLWTNKLRTLLVVLSVAVGVFAVGVIDTSGTILSRDLAASYAAVSPASATIYTTTSFEEDLVQSIRGMSQVREAEGRHSVTLRFRVGPDEWRTMQLWAIPDYGQMRVDRITPERGRWPPPEREMAIERASLDYMKADVGDIVQIEMSDGRRRALRIAGLIHDLNQDPTFFSGVAYGYITLDTLEWLGEPRDFNELHILVAGNTLDKQNVQRVARDVQDKMERSGQTIFWIKIPEPGEHPNSSAIQALMLLLGVLGSLSFLLSGFLVINMVSALLTQQVRQIGVMKAIGAHSSQIAGMYVVMVSILGLLALIVAAPLSVVGAYAMTRYIAQLMNFDITGFGFSPQGLVLEAMVSLIVPILSASYPILAGVRITVREAVSDYGLSQARKSYIDRLLGRVHGFSRPFLLSLHNTFQRKGRLALTLVTLSLAGAISVAVFSVYASMVHTTEDMSNYLKYDIQVELGRPYRIEQVEQEALGAPGIVAVESWGAIGIYLVRTDHSTSNSIGLLAPPATTRMVQPTMLQGRWLLPEDENAVVISTEVLAEEPGIEVGKEIQIKVQGRQTTWQVVGIARGLLAGPIAYANYPYFARLTRNMGQANLLMLTTEHHDATFESQAAKTLEEGFKRAGLRISSIQTSTDLRTRIVSQFGIIVAFLLIMAVLLATVGGLGLTGTMTLNVLERTREIGVMRAIGASDGILRQIVVVEGILIGILSWLIAVILALPLSKLLSDAVGLAFMQAPLSYAFSLPGALIWLFVVVILSALASFLPARNASRISVREALAYE
jgi:putative ABC transport system permease protein